MSGLFKNFMDNGHDITAWVLKHRAECCLAEPSGRVEQFILTLFAIDSVMG